MAERLFPILYLELNAVGLTILLIVLFSQQRTWHGSADQRFFSALALSDVAMLALDSAMTRAANVRAAELAKRFSHTRPNGARGLTALAEAGVSYRAAWENIAAGQQTAQAVMAAWMNSSGHRANILSAKYSRLGVGQAVVGGRTYWVQLFAD